MKKSMQMTAGTAITIPQWAAQDWTQHIPLERQIDGGAWETIDVRTLDDFGTAIYL